MSESSQELLIGGGLLNAGSLASPLLLVTDSLVDADGGGTRAEEGMVEDNADAEVGMVEDPGGDSRGDGGGTQRKRLNKEGLDQLREMIEAPEYAALGMPETSRDEKNSLAQQLIAYFNAYNAIYQSSNELTLDKFKHHYKIMTGTPLNTRGNPVNVEQHREAEEATAHRVEDRQRRELERQQHEEEIQAFLESGRTLVGSVENLLTTLAATTLRDFNDDEMAEAEGLANAFHTWVSQFNAIGGIGDRRCNALRGELERSIVTLAQIMPEQMWSARIRETYSRPTPGTEMSAPRTLDIAEASLPNSSVSRPRVARHITIQTPEGGVARTLDYGGFQDNRRASRRAMSSAVKRLYDGVEHANQHERRRADDENRVRPLDANRGVLVVVNGNNTSAAFVNTTPSQEEGMEAAIKEVFSVGAVARIANPHAIGERENEH